jgi:Ca2+-dependent lipid-binding protein
MATSIDTRRVKLTARAATELKSAALVGKNTPYLEITVGESPTVTTKPDKKSPQNPTWDQSFEIELPGAKPDEKDIILHVVAKNKVATPLVPDSVIGRGNVPLVQLFSTGKEEARVPLHDTSAKPAGVAFIGVEMIMPETQEEIRKFI